MRSVRSLARWARSSAQLVGSLEPSGISQVPLRNLLADFNTVPDLGNISTLHSFTVFRAFSISEPPSATPGPTPPLEITRPQDFSDLIAFSSTVPIILDAHAAWCGPCKQLDPVLKQLIASHGGQIALAKLDIDAPAMAPLVQQLQIKSVPTLFLIFGGRIIDVKMGVPPQAELRSWINKAVELAKAVAGAVKGEGAGKGDSAKVDPWDALREAFAAAHLPGAAVETIAPRFAAVLQHPSAEPKLIAAATAGLALCAYLEGDLKTARELLGNVKSAVEQGSTENDAATAAFPDEVLAVEATLAIAESADLALQGDTRGIDDLSKAIESNPKDVSSLYALALRLFLAKKLPEALDVALRVVRTDREWQEQAGRELVLRLADALGPSSDASKAARRRFSNIWFI